MMSKTLSSDLVKSFLDLALESSHVSVLDVVFAWNFTLGLCPWVFLQKFMELLRSAFMPSCQLTEIQIGILLHDFSSTYPKH